MVKKNINWTTRRYDYGLLLFGIILTLFSFYQLPTLLTFKSSLTKIKGTLRAADIYVTTATSRGGHESRKSELIFYINGRQQQFYFAENIGDEWRNEKYEKIIKGLKRADTVTVWVKKSEIDGFEPKVFQIDTERGTLLDFETVRKGEGLMTVFLFLLGLSSILAFSWFRFPDRFNKVFGTENATTKN